MIRESAAFQVKAFGAALQDAPWSFWQNMPVDWTPAAAIGRQQGLSPQATNSRLRTLEIVGAVERRRRGQYVEYRPFQHMVLDQIVVRRVNNGPKGGKAE